jgi:N12 class adenine-specific DNA methylase
MSLHKSKSAATEIWGTKRADAMRILQSALDGKPVLVYDVIDRESVVNHEESAKASGKAADMAREFESWLWEDDERRVRLHRLYNDTFNNMRLISYDGSHLTFPGMNVAVTLHPEQVNAAWRTIFHDPTLHAI